MDAIPLARASQIIEIARTLEDHGGSAERVLEQARLPMWHAVQPDELIPTRHIWLFMERAARTLGDPALGHKVGETDPVGSLGALGARLLRSATTYDALQTTCRQMREHTSNTRCWLGEAGATHIWFCCNMVAMDVGLPAMEQCILMQMIRIVRLGAGPTWRPTVVCLQARVTAGLAKAATFSDTEIRYGQPVTAIAVPRSLLPLPLSSDGRAGTLGQGAPPGQYRTPEPADDLAQSIRQVVGTWMCQEYPSIEVAAEAAGLSVRTLQRRLALEGLNYSELVEQARFQIAIRLLEDADVKVTDVAFDLGYSDVAHFSRAFHRWAGVSPRAYRRLNVAPLKRSQHCGETLRRHAYEPCAAGRNRS